MTVQEELIGILRSLPLDKQEEILRHARSVACDSGSSPRKRKLRGLWAGLNVDLSPEEITELRREMWGNFPRDFSG